MKKVRIILFTLAFSTAIAGAFATTALDAPVRGIIGGVCQIINQCTVVGRTENRCPIITDDLNYYSRIDLNCSGFPLQVIIRARVSQ